MLAYLNKTLVALCALVALGACGGGDDGVTTPGPTPVDPPVTTPVDPAVTAASPAMSDQPMDTIVSTKILPQIDIFFDQLMAQKLDMEVDGVKVFAPDSGDKFLPGKVAIGMSYLLLNTPASAPKFQTYLAGFREIADLTLNTNNESWGIYYYASALVKLQRAGLLEQAVSQVTLEALKIKLDYRTFVNPDYTLIKLPTNYYGVAFSIARLRHLLGWETADASEVLLQKMIAHYKTFSAFGFSDETDGSGRFDRYSVLLIGEIMQRLIETGMEPSADDLALLRGWLRQSVDLIKLRLNPAGNGVDFGRSLGPYADTAFAEVLSAAAHVGVLTEEEKRLAYAFGVRVAAKYVEFWYDDEMKSLNMWEKGRRVDSYRGKGRILGENLSLSHQLIYTNNLWKADGFADKPPMPAAEFVAAISAQPRAALTKFAGFDGQPATYDRALVTYRDGLRVFSLPLVNGAATYHATNPYFAVPYSYNMISGVADTKWPLLQPRFTMGDGNPLIPAAYIRNVKTQESGTTLKVTYDMAAMDSAAGGSPIQDDRLTSTNEYTFEPGRITRVDTYTPKDASQAVDQIELEFGTYSGQPVQNGKTFAFGSGDVTGFEVEGLDTCTATDVGTNADYRTPSGALATSVKCTSGATTLTEPLVIKWVLNYKTPSVASFKPN